MNEVTCKGSYALGTACGLCSKCIQEMKEAYPPKGEVHQLRVLPAPIDEPAKDLKLSIIYRSDGMMFIEAEKGIPAPILATMSFVLDDFIRGHMVRGGT